MANVKNGNRPLSPHLQVYRMYVTMVVSGLHRITGFALAGSAVLVVWWFVALASGPEYFAWVDWILASWIGNLVMILSLWAVMHHLLNGIRHLIWDTGHLLEVENIDRGAWVVLLGAPALTLLILIIIALA